MSQQPVHARACVHTCVCMCVCVCACAPQIHSPPTTTSNNHSPPPMLQPCHCHALSARAAAPRPLQIRRGEPSDCHLPPVSRGVVVVVVERWVVCMRHTHVLWLAFCCPLCLCVRAFVLFHLDCFVPLRACVRACACVCVRVCVVCVCVYVYSRFWSV